LQSCAIINRENIDSDDLTYIIIINSDQNNHYTAAYDFKQAVQVKIRKNTYNLSAYTGKMTIFDFAVTKK
jgi:hypothetical protein